MSLMDYFKLRTPQLQHLAGAGDRDAKAEIERRMRDAPATLDLRTAPYRELRSMVLAWCDGTTTMEQAEAFNLAQRAQEELEVRWRTRSRIGWRAEDADIFGPEGLSDLPVAPWLVPAPPRCKSWRRPEGSTHYPAERDIARAEMSRLARKHYDTAAGVPHRG